ncbi:hypothetical protein DFJ63DRAFT_62424 [Scheffersomyces coipomensis]|uniref:uncharacterized protein n=1 Tax=Scheffersomyces coipomensis TaxID=1788519 RepID=UPI00315C7893
MEKIDLSTNARKIQESYDKVVRGDPSTTYAVYSVNKDSSLEVSETGNGSLDEFVESFTDGQIQFGIARVVVPGSDVSKNLLLGWCPDNSPAKSRLSFASNFADVSKVLSGYHVQITARDQDDLDVDDFLHRVGAAAGARYSIQTSGSTVVKPPVSKPIIAKSTPKPVPAASSTPSFIPKSTGKPVIATKPKPIIASKPKVTDDGWGDEKDVEVRDFDQKPLDNVPSAYKPTKVDINHLRSQKSDTISSTPKPFKPVESKPKDDEDNEPKSLADRISSYKVNESERLTELPKPKVSHSVAARYAPSESTPAVSAPKFGAVPGQVNNDRKDKVIGGLSRNFASENGKTPAQIWAEKKGKYKTVPVDDEPVKSEEPELAQEFEEKAVIKEEPVIIKPSFGAPPRRTLPPVQAAKEPEPEEEEEEEEQEETTPSLPVRQAVPEPEEEEEEEEPTPSLPVRSLPPAPVKAEEPIPVLPSRTAAAAPTPAKKESITATAEYDYVKDEDNEIGFDDGDLIIEIEFTDDDWWTGKHSKTGEVGLFPAAYVKLNTNGAPAAAAEKEEEEEEEVAPPPPARAEPVVAAEPKSSKPTAVAEYDYERDEDNEIEFKEGDLIVEIEFIDEDWWSGKHSTSGESGLFPANYVKLSE